MKLTNHDEAGQAFVRLLNIMDDLRSGCPWDRKQTLESLRNLTIEEVYELADTIDQKDLSGLKEEIGDVLLHLTFYSKIASEQGAFTMQEAIHAICEKLIARHPHIYGSLEVADEDEVKKNWEQLKLKEGKKSVLSGVPTALPALIKAYRMQDKTAQVGFEWDNMAEVWDKVKEEMTELQEAVRSKNSAHIEEEFGDLLFSMVNYARFIGVDPETALEKSNQKFKSRFQYIEGNAPKPLREMSLLEMDKLWNEAKLQLPKPTNAKS